jgi:hypothetical protein
MPKHTQGKIEVMRVPSKTYGTAGVDHDFDCWELVAPTPEGLSPGEYVIADTLNRRQCISPEEDEANARHLVKCWNCHEELFGACTSALDRLEVLSEDFDVHSDYTMSLLRSALKLAEDANE